MSLVEKINNDLKVAMKAKEKEKLMALRAIKSALLLAQTAGGAGGEVNEAEEFKILQKQLKQRKDAAEMYKQQGREDLYEVEMNEASFIEAYLPKMLTTEEITEAVQAIIAQVGASTLQDLGKVMGVASKQLAGKADGKSISNVVKQLLS